MLRHKVLGTIAVALLVGVVGRRGSHRVRGRVPHRQRYPRLLGRLHSADVVLFPRQFEQLDTRKISAIPNVTRVAKAVGFGLASRKADGTPEMDFGAGAAASADGIAFYEMEQTLCPSRAGYRRPSRVDEILVNQTAARSPHLRVGSVYKASLFNLVEIEQRRLVGGTDVEMERARRRPVDKDLVDTRGRW